MNKFLSCFFALTSFIMTAFGQGSEMLVPKEAVVVFSINNTDLLNKISLDKMIQYEFMEEIQSELFRSEGITLKESGIDFNQRINFFNGKSLMNEVSGITMGIDNKGNILKVFNNFEQIKSHIEGVEIYRNELNYLFIQNNHILVVRVEPSDKKIKKIADSIWAERGNDQYFNPLYDFDDIDFDGDYEYDEAIDVSEINDTLDITEENSIEFENLQKYENIYWELRDSIRYELQQLYIRQLSTELFVNMESLLTNEPKFQAQLQKTADAIIFFDNARNLDENKGIWQFKKIFPMLNNGDKSLYEGNIIVGELNLIKNSIKVNLTAFYGEELGKIYQDLTKTKFVNNFQKYIYKDALGYFTYNVNLKNSYHTSFDIVMDMLKNNDDKETLSQILLAELVNEFVDVDNIFDTYQGSMFGSVNGYLSIKTSYIDYQYDDDTFEYSEQEVDTVRDIPNFTLGFKTNNAKFLNRLARVFSKAYPENTINHGTYFEVKDAILNSIPCYFAIVDDLLLVSVDENLFTTHLNGYAKSERASVKKAKKSKLTYIYLDIDKTIAKLPRETLNERQNEMISTMINKSGIVEFKTLSTNKKETKFELNLTFKDTAEDSGIHLLDLINSLYILSKK